MPKKNNIDDMLRKNLGTEVANRVIRQINKMIKAGASPARIQKAISTDLITHVQEQVAIAVVAKSYPVFPMKVGTGTPGQLMTFIIPFLPSGLTSPPGMRVGVRGTPLGGKK
jgi:hypothetical protein